MYPIPGISVLLAAVSFVLVMLTIFAGNKPGFMEDYHVLYVSTIAECSKAPREINPVCSSTLPLSAKIWFPP